MKKIIALFIGLFFASTVFADQGIAIIPHFMINQGPIHEIYRALSKEHQHIKNIIIISPDHFSQIHQGHIGMLPGTCKVFQVGSIQIPINPISGFNQIGLIGANGTCTTKDHGINEHISFIHDYFPHSNVTPILVSPRILGGYGGLLQQLKKFDPDTTLVIASVDFSHYISEPYALVHDALAKNIIQGGNIPDYSQLEVDCPACIGIAHQLGGKQSFPELIYRDSSSTITKKDQGVENTSRNFYLRTGSSKKSDLIIGGVWYGDIMNGRGMAHRQQDGLSTLLKPLYQSQNPTKNPDFYLHRLRKGLDFVGANRESVAGTGTRCKSYGSGRNITLCSDPTILKTLHQLGLTHLSIANNHIGDYGLSGAIDTIQIIKSNGIKPIGTIIISGYMVNEIGHGNIRGQNISFFAFDQTKYWIGITKACELVQKSTGFNIVSMHRGIEYNTNSSLLQQQIAYNLTKCGADVILGSHPHVIQPTVKVTVGNRSSIAAFSLGNFIFDKPPMGLKASGQGILIYGNKKLFTGIVIENPLKELIDWRKN